MEVFSWQFGGNYLQSGQNNRRLLTKIYKAYNPRFYYNSDDDPAIFDEDLEIIRNNLTGWKAVFEEVDMLNKRVFTIEDFDQMKPNLKTLYSNNKNIDAKIRQQLQFLRDLGLMQFVERGVYKKLWR